MDDRLRKLFEMLQGGGMPGMGEEKFEPLAPLSKKEAEEWDGIHGQIAKARRMIEEAEAKKKLFWAKIERKTKIYDRNMRIDNGMVLIEVQEKNNCKTQGKPTPGFCDGDCENCALGPHGPEVPE